MNHQVKRAVSLLCCGAVLAAACTGCGGSKSEPVMSSTVLVETQDAARGDINLQGSYVGQVSAGECVNIIPMVAGTVESVKVAVGSEVKAGQVLAKLDDESAQLTKANAQAGYNSAKSSAQSALGGQWELQSYQTAQGIKQLQEAVDTCNEQLEDLNRQRDELETEYNERKDKNEKTGKVIEKAAEVGTVEVTVTEANKQIIHSAHDDWKEYETGDTFEVSLLEQVSTEDIEDLLEELEGQEDMEAVRDILQRFVEKNQAIAVDQARLDTLFLLAAMPEEESGLSAEQAKALLELQQVMKETGLTAADLNSEQVVKDQIAYGVASMNYNEYMPQLDSGIKQLEASRDNYKTQLETTQGVQSITNDKIYNETVDQLQKGLASAQVGLDSADYQLSLYTLTSPIDGIVESVGLVEDSIATNSAIAFTVSNKDSMVVTFYVAEDVRDELVLGQPVTVKRSKNQYSGVITEIGNAVEMTKGLFKVKATIYNMPQLASGVTATITTTCHKAKDVVVIPCDAVYYDNGQAYVFVAQEGKAVKTLVETGIYDDANIAVLEGLQVGQKVITTWSPNLVDGADISVAGEKAADSNG